MPQVTNLTTMHFQAGTSDKVWGAAVLQFAEPAGREVVAQYVAFWGRRLGTTQFKTGLPTSVDRAVASFNAIATMKYNEGYRAIDWHDSDYGLIRTVRDLEFRTLVAARTRAPRPARPPRRGRAIPCGECGRLPVDGHTAVCSLSSWRQAVEETRAAETAREDAPVPPPAERPAPRPTQRPDEDAPVLRRPRRVDF